MNMTNFLKLIFLNVEKHWEDGVAIRAAYVVIGMLLAMWIIA